LVIYKKKGAGILKKDKRAPIWKAPGLASVCAAAPMCCARSGQYCACVKERQSVV